MKKEIHLVYETLSADELPTQVLHLKSQVLDGLKLAYSPYSRFKVGAGLILENSETLVGTNKENASFPAGTCAERNVLNYASDHFPGIKVEALLLIAKSDDFEVEQPIAPCGICRQVLCEVELMQQKDIAIYMLSNDGSALKVQRAADLLPFHFYYSELKK